MSQSLKHLATFSGWSILEDDYDFLVDFCLKHKVRRVVEFGPGDSTLAFAEIGCEVITLESDPGFHAEAVARFAGFSAEAVRFKNLAERHGERKALVEVRLHKQGFPESLPWIPDLVFVDGPEGDARPGRKSRFYECLWGMDRCGRVILHDAKRHNEENTLRFFETSPFRCDVSRVPTVKGLAVIDIPRPGPHSSRPERQ